MIAAHERGEARALLALAGPIALAMLGHMGLTVTDVIVSGRHDTDTLSAVAAGGLWAQALFIFGLGFLQGLGPFSAQAWGAGDRARAGAWLRRSIVCALALSVPLTAGLWAAAPVLEALGQDLAIVPAARDYCVWMAWGITPGLLFVALAAYLQSEGEVKSALWVVVGANALNVCLDLALVFGVPAIGLPEYGALGCAAASSACRGFMLLGLAWLCRARLLEAWRAGAGRGVAPALRLSGRRAARRAGRAPVVPRAVGVHRDRSADGRTRKDRARGALGRDHDGRGSPSMVPLGIGSAASTRIGLLIGQGRDWTAAARWTVGLSAVWSLLSALFMIIGGGRVRRARGH